MEIFGEAEGSKQALRNQSPAQLPPILCRLKMLHPRKTKGHAPMRHHHRMIQREHYSLSENAPRESLTTTTTDTAMTNAKYEQKLTDVVLMKNGPVVQSQLLLAARSRGHATKCTSKLRFQPENPL